MAPVALREDTGVGSTEEYIVFVKSMIKRATIAMEGGPEGVFRMTRLEV